MTEYSLIPLRQLALCSKNARPYVPEEDEQLDMLVASIVNHGLLQPIVVRAIDADSYAVVAGQRRVAALRAIDGGEGMVPALVLAADADANTASLAENYCRQAMKMIDVYTAFHRIEVEHPELSIEQIGEQFGFDGARARRVMRIANLSPLIMDEWRAGRLDEAAAQAYADSTSHERQDIAWHLIEEHPYWEHSRSYIKQALGFSNDRNTRRGLAYVGRTAYEAAGGKLEEDLFGENMRVENEELLSELALVKQMEELDVIRATLTRRNKTEAEGAKLDFTWVSEPPIHNGYVDYGLQVKLKGTKLPAKGSIVGTYKLVEQDEQVTLEPTYWYASREDYNLAHPAEPMSTAPDKASPKEKAEAEEVEPDLEVPVLTQRAADQVRAQRADMLVNHISATKAAQEVAHIALIYTMARALLFQHDSRGDQLGMVYGFAGHAFSYPGTSTEHKPPYLETLRNTPGVADRDPIAGFDLFEEWSANGGVDRIAALIYASKVQPQDGPGATLVDYLFTELSEPEMARRSWVPNTAFFDCFRKGTLLAWVGSIHPNFATEFAKKKLDDIKEGVAFFFRADDDSCKRYGISSAAKPKAQAWLPSWLRWHTLEEVKLKIEERRARHAALHGSDEEEAGDEDTPADDTEALVDAAFEDETWPQDVAAQ